MSEILAIAQNVWRRIFHMKVLYFLISCAVIEISITSLYKVLMANEHQLLMVDVSLLLTTIAGLLCVLSLAFDIPRELREGSAAALLSKPLGRTQYLIGKYVGITWVALVVTFLISCGFCAVYAITFGTIPTAAIQGHVLAVASVIPMAALALFFSSLLGEAPAAVLTTATIWLTHSVPALAKAKILYGGLIPDMNLFNLRAEASHSFAILWGYLIETSVWGIVYAIGLVALTGIFFNQRDLS